MDAKLKPKHFNQSNQSCNKEGGMAVEQITAGTATLDVNGP